MSSDEFHDEQYEDSLVRPFIITGGRTRHARVQLRVETLVVTRPLVSTEDLLFEHAELVRLCETPTSVAELSARLAIPLGVAQVLVGDLADAGYLETHDAAAAATPELLLRMIDAVRAL